MLDDYTLKVVLFIAIIVIVCFLIALFVTHKTEQVRLLKEQNRLIRTEVKQLKDNIASINKTNKLQDDQIKLLQKHIEVLKKVGE